MAQPWSQVIQSPQYQALPNDQKEAARQQYFQQVIAPQAGAQADQARAQFDAQYGPQHSKSISPDVPDTSPFGSAVASEVQKAQQEDAPTFGDDLARSALRTYKSFNQGVGGLGDLVLSPVRQGLNKLLPDNYQIPSLAETQDAAFRTIAPNINLDPQNALERYEDMANRSIGGVAGGVGLGGAMAGSSSPLASSVGNTLASNPGTQTIAALSGGTAAQTAKESGGGPIGQTVAGIAGGLGGALAPSAVSSAARNAAVKVIPVDQAGQELAQEALARGIPIKASQLSDSKTGKFLDSASGTLPFSGAPAFEASQKAAFNRALSKTIGADSDAVTPQVFDQARKATGDIYNDVWGRNNLALTPGLRAKVNNIVQQASIYDPAVGSQIKGAIDRISNNATLQNGKLYLPGSAFKALDSDLGAATAAGGTGANLIADLRYSLRDAMQKGMSGKDQALADQANRQWANQEAILPLVAKASAQGGEINPADIMARVTSNYAGKSAMARGTRGELGTLAQIGQRFLKPSPSSGTAERGMGYRSLEGAGKTAAAFAAGNVMSPVGGALTAGGTLLTARGLQNALQNQNVVRQAAGLTPDTPDYWQLLQSSITPSAQQATQ